MNPQTVDVLMPPNARHARFQRGGTMLGFIIGGVVGLLAALIVAVFVTKVPVPFVNKAVNRNAEQDAAETVKNKNWDPNAPLATKQPAKPTAAEVSGVVAPVASAPIAAMTPAASVPIKPVEKPVDKPIDKSAAKPAADPLGDLVKAKTAGVSATPPVAVVPAVKEAAKEAVKDSDAYFVQAGAYTTADDAEAQRGRLSLGGFESKVTEREVSGRTVFRVRVGPIEKKADADKARERLEGMGIEARVMSVSR